MLARLRADQRNGCRRQVDVTQVHSLSCGKAWLSSGFYGPRNRENIKIDEGLGLLTYGKGLYSLVTISEPNVTKFGQCIGESQ